MRLTLRPRSPGDLDGLFRLGGLALVAALASALTLKLGGLAGPFAALCLLPLAAALWTAEPTPAGEGAVLSLAALAVVVLGRSLGWAERAAPDWISPLLALGAVGTVLSLMALGLLRLLGRIRLRAQVAEAERTTLHRLLVEQPGLMLMLDGQDRVRAAFGEAPVEVSAERLFASGLAGAFPADSDALQAAVQRTRDEGFAEVRFGPRPLLLRLRRNGGDRLVGHVLDAAPERARAQALQAERDAALAASTAKTRFLADMSHELRTPLNAVMGFSDVMRSRLFGPIPDRYGEYAQLIHESGGHLLALINDILDVSKIEAAKYKLQLERIDAREPVNAALRLLRPGADEAGVHLRAVLPSAPLPAELDPRAVRQMLLNLVGNALKFTPRGGQVTVTLDAADGQLELTVADTGVGIAPEDLARLGRPYEQAGDAASQARGTGLGLSLVRALAGLHGGTMSIESALGEGAAVTVRMPVLLAAAADDDAPAA
jgi:cell cycle sensor histidine kinase DivJ